MGMYNSTQEKQSKISQLKNSGFSKCNLNRNTLISYQIEITTVFTRTRRFLSTINVVTMRISSDILRKRTCTFLMECYYLKKHINATKECPLELMRKTTHRLQ